MNPESSHLAPALASLVGLPFSRFALADAVFSTVEALRETVNSVLLVGCDPPFRGPLAAGADLEVHKTVPEDGDRPLGLEIDDGAVDCVVACDWLDRISARLRGQALEEMARVAARAVVVISPFESPVVTTAEEAVNEISRAARGIPDPVLVRHRDQGLPGMQATVRLMESLLGTAPAAMPCASLRSWAFFEMLEAAMTGEEASERLLGRLRRFHNARLATHDHSAPAYRHIVVALRGVPAGGHPGIRGLCERFGARLAEEEIRTARDLLRLVLDTHAQGLRDRPGDAPLDGALRKVRELERAARRHERTIRNLEDDLQLMKNSRDSGKAEGMLKKFFTP